MFLFVWCVGWGHAHYSEAASSGRTSNFVPFKTQRLLLDECIVYRPHSRYLSRVLDVGGADKLISQRGLEATPTFANNASTGQTMR
jgi:hypothetical protein